MAIPNPYPNIEDNKVSDVTTWSSSKIKAVCDAILELFPEEEEEP